MRKVLFRTYIRIEAFYVAGNPSSSRRHIFLQATVGMSSHLLTFNYFCTHTGKLKIFHSVSKPFSTWLQPIFLMFAFHCTPTLYLLANASPQKMFFIWRLPRQCSFCALCLTFFPITITHSSSLSLVKSYFNI